MTSSERVLRLSFAASLLLAASGCTLWFALNQDPDGIPCDPEGPPFCFDGYTCVEQTDGSRVCRLAAAGDEGELCQADTECADGLVCVNAYSSVDCVDPYDSGNCESGRALSGDDKRCRTVCNPNGDWTEQCTPGDRCFADSQGSGWCQTGTCGTAAECGNNGDNGLPNLCPLAGVNPGGEAGSGLCVRSCTPLDCNPVSGCPGCGLVDYTGDGVADPMGCEPYDGILDNLGCIVPGVVPADGACDNQNPCEPGSVCSNLILGGATGFCSKWCRPGGGAPECNAAHPQCNPVGNAGFGYCS
jgi:hypothetical protein